MIPEPRCAKANCCRNTASKECWAAGAFAYTYLALDTNLDTQVALKEFFPEGLAYRDSQTKRVRPHSGPTESGYRDGLERFLREGKVLAGFKHHNIVRIFRAFRANDTAYLVMDYERGQTLQDYLDQHRQALDYEQLKTIFLPLLDGLREVHRHQLMHLDIKPDNIFLREQNNPCTDRFRRRSAIRGSA
ncbi:MAG: protein kinase [Gammaproteobacteria bacterium]|nr:protein kinase [Gammaproteobacteria bacterium]